MTSSKQHIAIAMPDLQRGLSKSWWQQTRHPENKIYHRANVQDSLDKQDETGLAICDSY